MNEMVKIKYFFIGCGVCFVLGAAGVFGIFFGIEVPVGPNYQRACELARKDEDNRKQIQQSLDDLRLSREELINITKQIAENRGEFKSGSDEFRRIDEKYDQLIDGLRKTVESIK